ncbi:MAG: hypothetical protein LYZ69_01200 [Nitrososphaerales archaeon]|nr:hypothetical protein [Nitrososphaerales archaeon]
MSVSSTGRFYFYIEGILGRVYSGLTSYLAWGHLVLMTVGVDVSMFLMMWGGYMAGYALAPTAQGGGGLTTLQVHEQILGQLTCPIGFFIGLTALGALLRGLGYILRSRQK